MTDKYTSEQMTKLYLLETSQQLEQLTINCEKFNNYSQELINEIFKYMHTVKGSSMMFFINIRYLTYALEDLFNYFSEEKPQEVDYSKLSALVLVGIDLIKIGIEKIKAGDEAGGVASDLIERLMNLVGEMVIAEATVIQNQK